MNNDYYTQFKTAFLDHVTLKGYNADFIEGFFKRAEEEYSRWEALVQKAYNGNSDLCKQAYEEAATGLRLYGVTEKMANLNTLGPELLGLLGNLGSDVGGLFGQQGGPGLGGTIAGGGGGLLLGLILSQVLGLPLSSGMMLGALAGGGLGYLSAGTEAGQKNVFGVKAPPSPELPLQSAKPAAPPQGGPAASQVASNQQLANQTVSGAQPTPTMPAPPTPTAPPPTAAPKPPTPGAQPPGAPPLGAPAVTPPPQPKPLGAK